MTARYNKPAGRQKGRLKFLKHINIIVTKFLFYAPAFGILIPWITPLNLNQALVASMVATLAAYLTADLVIFVKYGDIPSVAADTAISLIVVLEMAFLGGAGGNVSYLGLLLFAVVIAAGEWYFHKYLKRALRKR